MKYLFPYTIGASVLFGVGLYDPTPALTDVILVFGSHLSGCMLASIVWLEERARVYKAEAKRAEARLASFNAGLQKQVNQNLTHSAR